MQIKHWIPAVLIGLALQGAAASHAGTSNWTNASGDDKWTNPLNWDLNRLPNASDFVIFGNGPLASSNVIDLNGAVETANTVEFVQDLNASGYVLQNGTLSVRSIFDGSTSGTTQFSKNVISANIYGGSLLIISSAIGPTFSGVIGGDGISTGGSVSVLGNGLFTNANTYTGQTRTSSALVFGGALGSALNSSLYDVEIGSLTLDNTTAANSNRLADGSDLLLRFGTFSLIGNATTPVAETVGNLRIQTGSSQINVTSPGPAMTTMTFNGITRSAGAVMVINPRNGPVPSINVKLLLANPATAGSIGGNGAVGSTTQSIIPYAIGQSASAYSFATYDNGPDGIAGTTDDVGLRPLANFEYAPTLVVGSLSANNVRLTAATSVTADTTVNSLVVSGTSVSIGTGNQLTVASGGIALDHGGSQLNAISGGTLNFGANESIIHAATSGNPTPDRYVISAALAGNSGLTKAGPGTVVLNVPGTMTGGVHLVGGELISAAAGALPTGQITFSGFDGGDLGFESVSQTMANPMYIDTNVALGSGSIHYGPALDVATGITATLEGNITADGQFPQLRKTGAGTLRYSGNSVAGFRVQSGTLVIDGTTATNGFVDVAAGTTLSGTGTIHDSPVFDTGSILAPGDPTGTLSITSIAPIASNFTMRFELDGPTNYAQVKFLGGAQPAAGTNISLVLNLGYTPALGSSFEIVDNGFFAFAGLPEGSTFPVGSSQFQVTYLGGNGHDIILTAVPEPAASALLPLLSVLIRRRRNV